MHVFRIFILLFVISSCGSEKKEIKSENKTEQVKHNLSLDSKIFLGNRLFSEKTCIKCHAVDHKKIGPSVVEIMHVYRKNEADIVAFLRGKSKPIVDTTASQVAIMQDNINGFLKDITDVELDAIATYMTHVDELQKKK